uniref:Uncharacterized protein n=1 Tax=Cannabis sativa TaxID=3483 RepID=A0A803PUR4_CANSA
MRYVLSDPQKKAVYDQYSEEGLKGQMPPPDAGGPGGALYFSTGDGPTTFQLNPRNADDIFAEFFRSSGPFGGLGGMGGGGGGYFSMLAKKPDELTPLFVTLVKKNAGIDPSPTPSSVKNTRSEVESFIIKTNMEVLAVDVLPELNTMMSTVDIVSQMLFHNGFGNGLYPKWFVEGNGDVRDNQDTEVPATIALNFPPLSYQILRKSTQKRRPCRENHQIPGTSSSHPDRRRNARGTTNARGLSDARRTSEARGTIDGKGPSDSRGTNDVGFSDPFSSSTSYDKFKEKRLKREDKKDNSHYISMGGRPGGELYLGKFSRDK